jgi:hypothetical protein
MTEVGLKAIFPSLEAQAARLNEASDNANQLLTVIENRLIALNIGLEVWHSEPVHIGDAKGNLGPYETSSQVVQKLGFARIEGKWCLALKPVCQVDGFFQGDTDCPYQNQYSADAPTSLLKASRGLRINALQAMPKFLAELNERIGSTIRQIEDTADQLQ